MKRFPKLERPVRFQQDAVERASCPFCGGRETELYALFGSQISTSQHYCRVCRVAFEQFKWAPPRD